MRIIVPLETAHPFPVTQGLRVQREDLTRWRSRLNADCYLDLCAEAARQNLELGAAATGYDVWRGGRLAEFVQNWRR